MMIESAPPFIDTRRGGVHVREGEKSPFLPESGAHSEQLLQKVRCGAPKIMALAVRLSWAASWPCKDHAGVPAAPVGVVASPVEGTVLCARCGGVSRVLQVGVLLRSRPGPRLRVAPMLFEGSPVGKVRGKYGELAAQW